VTESFLTELKRYVRFGAEDGDALRAFADTARPHFGRIIDEFYSRLHEHDAARAVFDGPEQVSRLKVTLGEWLSLLFTGPWDDAYYERRARIGRVHVRIRLPQKYMFGAMDLIRIELVSIAESAALPDATRVQVVRALHKIIDIELAIMLETYGETYVQQVQELEKVARQDLERRLELSEARYDEVVEKGEALTVTFEPSGRMILFNRRAEEITGVDRAVATQRYWFDLFCVPSDRELVRRAMDAVLAGKRVPPYEGPVLGPSGAERRVRWHFTTLPGTQGQILCAIGIDVTEERELATRTRRAERLAALGTMAAGLAHEIRNPLNAAHIQLTLAQRRIARHSAEPPEGVKVALDLAGSEMKRLAVLVEDFLQFARPQPPRLAFVDLRATAEVTVALVAPEAAALGVELALEPGEPLRLEFDDEILIVDDEANARAALSSEILREEGYETETAADGFKALGKLGSFAADLVLTDLKMPGLDGIGLLREVRTASPSAVVVVMTAFGTIDSAVEAIKLGAENYLTKPLEPDEPSSPWSSARHGEGGAPRRDALLRERARRSATPSGTSWASTPR
jgi:PAS domain S-box-containing protein